MTNRESRISLKSAASEQYGTVPNDSILECLVLSLMPPKSPFMICAHCSAEMPDISGYCPACGEPVHADAEGFRPARVSDALLAALAYFAVIPAIVLLLVPATRRSPFIRFHAWQGIFFAVAAIVLALVLRLLFLILAVLPLVGFLFAWLLVGVSSIAFVVAWLALVVKAALGHCFEIPFIGPLASRLTTEGPFADSDS